MSVIENTKQFAPAGSWTADPVHSNVSFEVGYAGVNTFRGSFSDFSASLRAASRRPRGHGQGRVGRRQGRAAQRPSPDAGLLRRAALPRDHVQGHRAAPPRGQPRRGQGRAHDQGLDPADRVRASSPESRRPTRSAASASASRSRPRSTARSTASAGTRRTRAAATTSRNDVKLIAELAFVKAEA